MAITDDMVSAAAKALLAADPLGNMKVLCADELRALARAALEAGERAAWSTDMEAAPALTDLLVWIGHKVKECMVFKDKNGTRAWSVEDSDYRDEDIRAWRLRPTPPTEGDR